MKLICVFVHSEGKCSLFNLVQRQDCGGKSLNLLDEHQIFLPHSSVNNITELFQRFCLTEFRHESIISSLNCCENLLHPDFDLE